MNEERRGFLKQMIVAGTALITPNSEKKLILPGDIEEPPKTTSMKGSICLGDYVLIPRKNIMSFSVDVPMYGEDLISTSQRSYRQFMEKRSVKLRIDAVFDSEDSQVHVAPTGKQCLIIGGTTVLELE